MGRHGPPLMAASGGRGVRPRFAPCQMKTGTGACEEWCQTACKPGSVRTGCPALNGHSSGTRIAARLARPTRATGRKCPCDSAPRFRGHASPAAPIRSCSRWGLPCRPCCQGRGALLPHRFTLADGGRALAPAVCSLWHFPWGRPRRPLAGTVFPWSPDFPPPGLPPAAAVQPSGPPVMRPGGAPVNRRATGFATGPARA